MEATLPVLVRVPAWMEGTEIFIQALRSIIASHLTSIEMKDLQVTLTGIRKIFYLVSPTLEIQIRAPEYILEVIILVLLEDFQDIQAAGLRAHHRVDPFLEFPAPVPVAAVVVEVQSHGLSSRQQNSPYLKDCVEETYVDVYAVLIIRLTAATM
jgi:hypothetical protein